MMTLIKPVAPFTVPQTTGKAGRRVSTDDRFAPETDLARLALDLGCLRDVDARAVAKAQGIEWPAARPAASAVAVPEAAQVVDTATVAPAKHSSGGRK